MISFIPTNYSTKLLNSVEIPLVENVFWKYYFEEFVLSSRRVLPLTKPFLDPYYMWQDEKCVCWNVSVGFVHNRIQEWDFVFRDFCCEVNCSVMTICFFEKVCYQLFSSDIPKREDVVWSIYFFHQTGFLRFCLVVF